MGISARGRWRPRERDRWLLFAGGAAAILVVAGAIAAGLGSGIFNRGPFPGPVAVSPSPSPTPTPTPSPSPTVTPSPTPPPSVVAALRCRIAVSSGNAGSGGWITFPRGQFSFDPASDVHLPGPAAGSYAFGLTHDAALNRWLPVPRQWVTPDGLRYVYYDWSAGFQLHAVEKDGSTRPLARFGAEGGWTLLSAEPEGVYVAGSPGLYLARWDGTVATLSATGYWTAVGGGFVYGSASQSLPSGAANVVLRLNLKTGATSSFFTEPGMTSMVEGFGAGGVPVVQAGRSDLVEVWLAGTPPVKVLSYDLSQNRGDYAGVLSALGDQYGTWIATTRALYLYSASAGLEQASAVTGQLASACH